MFCYQILDLIKRTLRDYPELDNQGKLSNCIKYLESGIEKVYESSDLNVIMGLRATVPSHTSIFLTI